MALSPADLQQISNLIATQLAASGVKISALPPINVVPRLSMLPIVAEGSTQRMTMAQLLGQAVTTVPVGQDLRAMDTSTIYDQTVFITEGVLTPNDGGGGYWIYDSGSVADDNTGTVISPDTGVGRFLRIYSGDIHLIWFGALLGDTVTNGPDNDVACLAAVTLAAATGATLVLPQGTLVISTHFPIRNSEVPPTSLVDYNGITVMGSGRSSIVKQWNEAGTAADVFNLNGVKNVNLINFTIQSQIDPGVSTSGTNAVSVINGGENILCRRIHADKMPYILYGPDFDGGAAFSIQHATNALNDRNIQFIECSAEGDAVAGAGSYGFNLILSGADQLTNPAQGIVVQGCVFRELYRGVLAECIVSGVDPAQVEGMQVSICNNQFFDTQQCLVMYGMTGVNFEDNQFAVSFVGDAGFNPASTTKLGIYALSNYNCNLTGNILRMAECSSYATVGGGATAAANTPTDRLNFSDNHFFGTTDAAYGLMSTTTVAYGGTTNSNFVGNTFQGVDSGEDYHPLFSADGASNAIVSVTGSYFPEVIQSTFSATAGSEQIGGWNQGSSPFSTLTVNTNGHDIDSLIAGGAGDFCGWEIDLVIGRVYELVASASSGQLIVSTNSDFTAGQNGSLTGGITTTERSMIFQATANDNFIILKSAGAYNASVDITLREVPINCQAGLWVKNHIRMDASETFDTNIDAINAGLGDGVLFSDGSGFVHVVQPL